MDPRVTMKFSGPLESQRLSLLLEMAISREAQMWKAHVPKIQPNQVMSVFHIIRPSRGRRLSGGLGVGAAGGVQEQLPFLRPGESASEGSDSLFI